MIVKFDFFDISGNTLLDISQSSTAHDGTITDGTNYLIDQTYVLEVEAEDDSSNSDIYTSDMYYADFIPPGGVFTPNSVVGPVASQLIVFNPSDIGGSGIKEWRYRISTDSGATYGSWSSYITGDSTSNINLTSSGTNRIQTEIEDNNGNSRIINSGTYGIQ